MIKDGISPWELETDNNSSLFRGGKSHYLEAENPSLFRGRKSVSNLSLIADIIFLSLIRDRLETKGIMYQCF